MTTTDGRPTTDRQTKDRPRQDARQAALDEFCRRVVEACADPGTRQALRSAQGKTVEQVPARAHAALLRHGILGHDVHGERKRAHYAVAALIAARPSEKHTGGDQSEQADPDTRTEGPADAPAEPAEEAEAKEQPKRKSLGASLADAEVKRKALGGFESRLHLLVRQDSDGLHRMLPGLLRLMRSSEVEPDHGRLLADIEWWSFSRDRTSTVWLEDYYRALHTAESEVERDRQDE
ncbi:type I-E CRISPR-associated protein Cse2/CasB [Streptomyces bohaiensis]|uniref:Type I-E CRISPR-associated protein Cse2/CasB n=1 Tax=Streptomyces bohaiensis TaxID=1431344 RepID=A0ABX1C625_9ACTN|nr:type I-E CRISPR-associated protein Cse2/CasB [Streptomyces bohaiensis]NJQ14408.1 type I-E CRISPR-associated protein Cse2/CasB [Streptomyces bohaiensis]